MTTVNAESLPFPERFVLWSIRVSLAPHLTSAHADRTLRDAFRLEQLSTALPICIDFMGIAALGWHTAKHDPDIRCTCASSIGANEWRLLQARNLDAAIACIANVMQRSTLRLLMDRGLRFASLLQQRGCAMSIGMAQPPVASGPFHNTHIH